MTKDVNISQESQGGETAHRVRIGLTGLAFVFLLVLIGTAILRGTDPATIPPSTIAAEDETPVEPMAEIGAAPATPKADVEPVEELPLAEDAAPVALDEHVPAADSE